MICLFFKFRNSCQTNLKLIMLFQKYRDDNKDPLKIYTNPDYFFELWRDNIQKETERSRQEKKDKKRRAKDKEKECESKYDLMSHV